MDPVKKIAADKVLCAAFIDNIFNTVAEKVRQKKQSVEGNHQEQPVRSNRHEKSTAANNDEDKLVLGFKAAQKKWKSMPEHPYTFMLAAHNYPRELRRVSLLPNYFTAFNNFIFVVDQQAEQEVAAWCPKDDSSRAGH